MARYNKEQVNPFSKKWEVTGVANLTELDAETLNNTAKHSGVRYVKAKKENKK